MKRFLGSKGEELAKKKLKNLGYKIVLENYDCPIGEIDLIAWDQDTLVFVEVRSRHSQELGLPQETVNFKKQQKVRRVAQYYLVAKGLEDSFCRFDVVAITWGEGEKNNTIEVIQDCF